MKQIPLDEALRAKLAARAPDVDPEKISVFRAAALSTAAIRKRHPLYNGAKVTPALLAEMQTELHKESRPLQIMHGSSDGDQLPIGRVFEADLSTGTGVDGADELITLFWIDNTHPDLIAKVNSGTVDQVSVAFLAKTAKSSVTDFDFFGPKATFENVWGGIDDKGNKMGENGAYAVLDGLAGWYEMSLVGQGGAQGAKILSGGQLQLTSSGQDVPSLTLELSTGPAPTPKPPEPAPKKDMLDMDAKEFAALIAAEATKLANAQADAKREKERADGLQTQLDAANAKVTELSSADQATKLTTATARVTELETQLSTALALPGKLLAPLFAMSGQATATLDPDETKAIAQVKDIGESLKAVGARLGGGGAHLSLAADNLPRTAPRPNSAFRRTA